MCGIISLRNIVATSHSVKQGDILALFDINDNKAVLAAVAEYDKLGRERFLEKYGFGKARSYFLVIDGRRYDSKAIIGVAHRHQYPSEGALRADQFSGGALTVAKILDGMGFIIDRPEQSLGAAISIASDNVGESGTFSPEDIDDARRRTLSAIVQRQGQGQFRSELLRAYGGQCAISMCSVADVLEAAHIIPYQGPRTNHVNNGLLLRTDLHTLFDLNLLSIEPRSKLVIIAPPLRFSEYGALHEKPLRLPAEVSDRPNEDALMARYVEAGLKR